MKQPSSATVPTSTAKRAVFHSLRLLVTSALLVALSIVFGKYLAVTTPLFRFSLENLPILLAGIYFGPVIGGTVGAVADLIGCVLVGYDINPLITLGSSLVGVVSGLSSLIFRLTGKRDPLNRAVRLPSLWISVFLGHIVGSMIVKSIGMSIYFGAPIDKLLWRIPLYIVTGAVEGTILSLLNRNRLFIGELNRLCSLPSRHGGTAEKNPPAKTTRKEESVK